MACFTFTFFYCYSQVHLHSFHLRCPHLPLEMEMLCVNYCMYISINNIFTHMIYIFVNDLTVAQSILIWVISYSKRLRGVNSIGYVCLSCTVGPSYIKTMCVILIYNIDFTYSQECWYAQSLLRLPDWMTHPQRYLTLPVMQRVKFCISSSPTEAVRSLISCVINLNNVLCFGKDRNISMWLMWHNNEL